MTNDAGRSNASTSSDVVPRVADLDLPAIRAFDWKDGLTRFGVLASALWCAIVVFSLCAFADWKDKPTPNELGDLAAGFAAPLALFWLVLGFFQQGKELRVSSRALMLQVEELRNTVKHQGDIAGVARRQEEIDIQERKRAAQPKFNLGVGKVKEDPNGPALYEIVLSNSGAVATDVEILAEIGFEGEKHISVLGSQARNFRLNFPARPKDEIPITIKFIDAEGSPGQAHFRAKPVRGGFRFDPQLGPVQSERAGAGE